MKAAKVLILGAGGHGRVLLEALRSRKMSCAFLDADPSLRAKTVDGAKVEGGDDLLTTLSPKRVALANGVGAAADVSARRAVYERARTKGFRFPPVVAASACVSPRAELDDGAQVLTRAVVHPGAKIGLNAVINTGAIVEHDASVGAHSFVGPAAVLLGGVRVGDSVFIGAGAVILPGIEIGDRALIAAGSIVTRAVAAGRRVAGAPARPLR